MRRVTLQDMNKPVVILGLPPLLLFVLIIVMALFFALLKLIAFIFIVPIVLLIMKVKEFNDKGNDDVIGSFFIFRDCPECIDDTNHAFGLLISDKEHAD